MARQMTQHTGNVRSTQGGTVIAPKHRPPAIQRPHGKMKPGHHTRIAESMRTS